MTAQPPGSGGTSPPPAETGNGDVRPDETDDAHGPPATASTQHMREALSEAQAEAALMADRWRRAVADVDNVRKRAARELSGVRADERARVVADWLPVLDNIELALSHSEGDPEAIVEGVRAVHEQMLALLDKLGFVRVDSVGEAFDPTRHEAVATMPTDEAKEGSVVHVVRPGYEDSERVLRPASVVVASRTT